MKRVTKFPGRPLPHTPPPPPNSYLHLRPVVIGSVQAYGYGTNGSDTLAVNDAISFAVKAAREAWEQAKGHGCDEQQCHVVAAEAYVNNLPELDHIVNIRMFIGAVAAGVKRNYIAAPQARLLLYTAQLQLAAMTRRVQ